ncbi:hypothetical protein KJ742_05480 [Patescibacteria group bacterium]|nr:hypothetical protein [Patescibacteria group bacterium]MBU1683369.1 hypothetical protein [Patescibacteria group bacterium]
MSTATKTKPQKKTETTPDSVKKAAGKIFSKIQAKTGIDNKKVDAWQKSWLGMPENRKKYEHLKDAPQVAGEELVAMSNDIIDFIQGEETGQSHIFKQLKAEWSSFFQHPGSYVMSKYKKGEEIAKSVTAKAKEGMKKAKSVAGKAKAQAGKAKEVAKKAKSVTKKTKKK